MHLGQGVWMSVTTPQQQQLRTDHQPPIGQATQLHPSGCQVNAVGFQDPAGPTVAVMQHSQHQVLRAEVAVAGPFGLLPGQVQNRLGVLATLGHRCRGASSCSA
jgi:hypothetical protein